MLMRVSRLHFDLSSHFKAAQLTKWYPAKRMAEATPQIRVFHGY